MFQGAGSIQISGSGSGTQFGPTILAPFAHVILDGQSGLGRHVGYVDGLIIAKSLGTTGDQSATIELHGVPFTGPVISEYFSPPPPPSPPPPKPPRLSPPPPPSPPPNPLPPPSPAPSPPPPPQPPPACSCPASLQTSDPLFTCRVSGNEHYKPFQSAAFEFMPVGVYRLASAPTACGCNVEVQTFSCPCRSTACVPGASAIAAVAVQIGDMQVTIEGDQRLTVSGGGFNTVLSYNSAPPSVRFGPVKVERDRSQGVWRVSIPGGGSLQVTSQGLSAMAAALNVWLSLPQAALSAGTPGLCAGSCSGEPVGNPYEFCVGGDEAATRCAPVTAEESLFPAARRAQLEASCLIAESTRLRDASTCHESKTCGVSSSKAGVAVVPSAQAASWGVEGATSPGTAAQCHEWCMCTFSSLPERSVSFTFRGGGVPRAVYDHPACTSSTHSCLQSFTGPLPNQDLVTGRVYRVATPNGASAQSCYRAEAPLRSDALTSISLGGGPAAQLQTVSCDLSPPAGVGGAAWQAAVPAWQTMAHSPRCYEASCITAGLFFGGRGQTGHLALDLGTSLSAVQVRLTSSGSAASLRDVAVRGSVAGVAGPWTLIGRFEAVQAGTTESPRLASSAFRYIKLEWSSNWGYPTSTHILRLEVLVNSAAVPLEPLPDGQRSCTCHGEIQP